ncbi:MAG: hypothetical protein ACFFA5_03505 [Promethearchaeota archaeon]
MVDKIDVVIAITAVILGFGCLFRWCESPTVESETIFCLGNILMLSSLAFLRVSISLCLLYEQRKI